MATPQQITANQANAQKSTGPQTEAGKARSSQNAFKHGLRTQEFVVLPQDQPEFEKLRDSLFDEIRPEGSVSELHFEHLLEAAWNRRRCRRAEAALVRQLGIDPLIDEITDPAAKKRFATIERYARRAERAFDKSYKEILRLQTEAYNRRALEQEEEDGVNLSAWGLADITAIENARIQKKNQHINAVTKQINAEARRISAEVKQLNYRAGNHVADDSRNSARTNPMTTAAA